MSKENLRCVRVLISGRVQGVCFRAFTREEANRLGLAGWVRNLRDRRVEALFEGERELVEEMIEWCWRGSPYGRVTDVQVIEEAIQNRAPGFDIEH